MGYVRGTWLLGIAFECPAKEIEACNRWSHCKLICNCNYTGKKFISGSLSVQRSYNNSCAVNKSGVRLPVLPVQVYSSRVVSSSMPWLISARKRL